jgi:hypothetical protein
MRHDLLHAGGEGRCVAGDLVEEDQRDVVATLVPPCFLWPPSSTARCRQPPEPGSLAGDHPPYLSLPCPMSCQAPPALYSPRTSRRRRATWYRQRGRAGSCFSPAAETLAVSHAPCKRRRRVTTTLGGPRRWANLGEKGERGKGHNYERNTCRFFLFCKLLLPRVMS